jgi:hypothetical protein
MEDGFYHKVADGEWVTKIAVKYNISNWKKTVWDHPKNAELSKRRSPNILHPGDLIFIPAPNSKPVACPTDQQHRFIVKRVMDTFQARLLDAAGKPIKNEKYTLKIGPQEFSGTTDDNGEIHQQGISPVGDHEGTLALPGVGIFHRVSVGGLNPTNATSDADHTRYDGGISGIQMRLKNLGYDPGATDGVLSDETAEAIVLFQTLVMKLPPEKRTGQLDDDTRNAIVARHGS